MDLTPYLLPKKPVVPIMKRAIAPKPTKNFIWNLLYGDIQRLQAMKSLDAACGQLRNYWMFTKGAYCGLDRTYSQLVYGQQGANNRRLINQRGRDNIELVCGDMERHLDSLGEFDLCVSTGTIEYIDNAVTVLGSLSDTIHKAGNLLISMSGKMNLTETIVDYLISQYEIVELIYMQSHEVHEWEQSYNRQQQPSGKQKAADFSVYSIPEAKIKEMTFYEMSLPNVAELHMGIYVRALNKNNEVTRLKKEKEGALTDDGIFVFKDMDLLSWGKPQAKFSVKKPVL